MDLGFTAEEEAFREEVRTWLDRNLPAEWRHGGVGGYREDDDEDIQRGWQRRLHEGGWLKLAWPREAGGRGATPVMQAIYQEEMAQAGAPVILGRLGVSLLAPTLLVHGIAVAEGDVRREDPQRRADLLPGLQRARRGQRPRRPAHARREARRQVGAQRPEDLVERRALRRQELPARAHRRRTPKRTRASASSSSTCTSPASRCGRSADDRRRRVLRDLPLRTRRSRIATWSASRATAGRSR